MEIAMSNTQTPDVAYIVAHPTEFGFHWIEGKVQKGDLGPWSVPLVKHDDVDLLRATFGDEFFLNSADGTSRHVTNQRIARDMKAERPRCTADEIKTAIVQNQLGMKSRRTRTVVEVTKYSFGGKTFDKVEDAQAYAREVLTAKGYDEAIIEDIVATI
jgi:hypothetical protein